MRRFLLLVGASALLVAACEADRDSPTSPLEPDAPQLTIVYTDAIETPGNLPDGGYAKLVSAAAYDCGEDVAACAAKPGFPFPVGNVAMKVDSTNWYDAATFTCPSGEMTTFFSNELCWECKAGCTDGVYWACGPNDDACVLHAGKKGGDCRGYQCPAGYEIVDGYSLREARPQCWKSVTLPPPPPTAALSGPTQIPIDDYCTWTATVSGGTSPFTFTWYYDGLWRKSGSDNTYTGGVLSGDTNTRFYLKVVVKDKNGLSGSKQILVEESPTARPCPL